jgi:hypothetical protein
VITCSSEIFCPSQILNIFRVYALPSEIVIVRNKIESMACKI